MSEATLREAAAAIADEYPGVACTRSSATSSVTSHDASRRRHAASSRSSAARSGTSPRRRGPVPRRRSRPASQPGDAFLLGTDLVKDLDRLVAAYDDAAGVTAEFNRNVLHVLNRELGADFDPDAFDARRPVGPRRASGSRCGCAPRGAQTVRGRRRSTSMVEFAAGEEMRTEICAKFRRERGRGRARRGRARASTSGGPTPPATSPSR